MPEPTIVIEEEPKLENEKEFRTEFDADKNPKSLSSLTTRLLNLS